MNIELKILDWIQTLHTPFLDKIMVFITRLGDVGIIWIVLSIVLLLIPKTRKSGAVMVAALVVDVLLCNIVLKNLVARTRPYDVNTGVHLLVAKLHDYSFPKILQISITSIKSSNVPSATQVNVIPCFVQ